MSSCRCVFTRACVRSEGVGWGVHTLHCPCQNILTICNTLLQVNKAFADKFAAVERLKDGMCGVMAMLCDV